MSSANYVPEVLETTSAERLATGFVFTEGSLWHPVGGKLVKLARGVNRTMLIVALEA